jgi:hypothetical protein
MPSKPSKKNEKKLKEYLEKIKNEFKNIQPGSKQVKDVGAKPSAN